MTNRINTKELSHKIKQLIGTNTKFLVIHSSLFHFKVNPHFLKWDLLNVLRNLAKEGLTLAIPTFTFSFTKTGVFDPLQTASEVGMLGDWTQELNDAQRTHHPLYSFSVLGDHSQRLLDASHASCFGKNSIFDFFDKNDTAIMMFGCDWSYCTQFHYYEEVMKVPYRYQKKFQGKLIFHNQEKQICTEMFVRDLKLNIHNDFTKIEQRLRSSGHVNSDTFLGGTIEIAKVQSIRESAIELLKNDLFSLVKHSREAEYFLKNICRRKKLKPLKIALLGNSNFESFKHTFEKKFLNYFFDQEVEFFIPEYGQMYQNILEENSHLKKFNPDFIFIMDRLEDIYQVNTLNDINQKNNISVLNHYIDMINQCAKKYSANIIVNNFAMFHWFSLGAADVTDKTSIAKLVLQSNIKLENALCKLPHVMLFDLNSYTSIAAVQPIDSRLWFLGKIPFSSAFNDYLANKYIGILLSKTERTVRMLAIDLDNTLWGGILGEDGMTGIQLGGDFPGNAFLAFQNLIQCLANRGLAIAIVSKNDENLALKAIDTLPFMKIRSKDLAIYRINWQEKSENLIQIAREIGISLEHILFIDDNPVEREKVKRNIPEVKILNLPSDPTLYCQTLLECPYIEITNITHEDKNRNQYYVKKRKSEQQKSSFENIEDFFEFLEIKISISRLNDSNISRAVQLLNKTNQFNTTTKRFSQSELLKLEKNVCEIFVIGLEDNVSNFENIGVLILDYCDLKTGIIKIDNLLLSCRVLGKSIENAVLSWVLNYSRHFPNAHLLSAEIIFTERNSPVKNVYEKCGFVLEFEDQYRSVWKMNMKDTLLNCPKWITLIEDLSITQLENSV